MNRAQTKTIYRVAIPRLGSARIPGKYLFYSNFITFPLHAKRGKIMRTTAQETLEAKNNAIAFLKKNLKPGATVYTIVRHVSSSGMSRNISAFIVQKNEHTKKQEIQCIDFWVSRALEQNFDRNKGGLKVHGCGMDMCFDLVYRIGRKLYPKGFKLPKGKHGRNGDTSGFDTDGGYALHYENL